MFYRLLTLLILIMVLPFWCFAELNPGEATIIFTTNNTEGQLIENCEQEIAVISIVLASPATDTLFFRIDDNSTAKRDTDFVSDVPDTLMFLPGDQQANFLIRAINDGIPEFPDLIRYDLFSIDNGNTLCDFVEVILRDGLEIRIEVLEDQSSFCVPPSVTLTATGAPQFEWSPSFLFDDPTLDTVVVDTAYRDFIIAKGIGFGCDNSIQIELSFTDPTFTIQKIGSDTICLGDTLRYTILPNEALDQLTVTPKNWIVSNLNNEVILLPDTSGWISFEAIKDTCTFIDSVFVTADRIVVPQLIQDTILCPGDTIQLASIGFNTLLTSYIWTPTSGLNNPFLPDPISIPSQSTLYQVTSTGNLGFCIETDSVQVEVLDTRIEYNLLDISTICLGDTVEASLNLQEEANIFISPRSTTSLVGDTLLQFYPLDDQTYSILVDFGSCRDSFTQNIEVIDGTVRTEILSDSIICLGDSIVIKVVTNDVPLSLTWTPDSDLIGQNDSVYVFMPDSSLSLDLFVDFGFCQYAEKFDITSRDNRFNIDLGAVSQLCLGDTVVGLISFSEQPDDFSFTPSEGFRKSNDSLFFNPSVSTQYTFMADYGACSVVREFDMEIDSLPSLALTTFPNKESFCIGETITVSNLFHEPSLYPDLSFDWSPNDVNLISDPTVASAQFMATIPNIYVRTSTNNRCVQRDTFNLAIVTGEISTAFLDTSICMGTSLQFNIEDGDIDNLLWTPEGSLSCSDCPNPIISPNETTVYNLDYQRESCDFDEQITVRIVQIDTIVLDPILGCMESMVSIDITTPELSNGVWDFADNLSCLECTDPEIILRDDQNLVIRDISGECERVGIMDVTVIPLPVIEISLVTNPPLFLGQEIMIIADINDISNPNLEWTVNGEVDVETSTTLSFIADQTSYNIVANLTEDTGLCTSQDDLIISVDILDNINFPNLFSPNGDNTNDVFRPAQSDALTITSMKIFNRWGQIVFENTNSQASWDGTTNNGDQANVDTYIYIVNIRNLDGSEEIFTGEVSLVR